MAKSLDWRSDRPWAGGLTGRSGQTGHGGGLTGFHLCSSARVATMSVWVRSSSCGSLHMCCMMHVLSNMGQVVKNLFPISFACLLLTTKLPAQ